MVRYRVRNRRLVVKETPYLGQGTSHRRGAMDAFARASTASSASSTPPAPSWQQTPSSETSISAESSS
jgi:hypothetical protein